MTGKIKEKKVRNLLLSYTYKRSFEKPHTGKNIFQDEVLITSFSATPEEISKMVDIDTTAGDIFNNQPTIKDRFTWRKSCNFDHQMFIQMLQTPLGAQKQSMSDFQ